MTNTVFNEQLIRLYDTVFDRAPDAGGLEFWNKAADGGYPMLGIVNLFITAPEFAQTYGAPNTLGFVQEMYANVLDRTPEAEGLQYWTGVIDSGAVSRADVVWFFSESREHTEAMNPPPQVEQPPLGQPGNPPPVIVPPQPEQPPAGEPGGRPIPNFIFGTDGSDVLNGTNGQDDIRGGLGSDVINGGPGADFLSGGRGADVITGGAGRDLFQIDESGVATGPNRGDYELVETITDFVRGEDRIDLSATFGGTLAFLGSGASFEARSEAGQSVTFFNEGDRTVVQVDVTGEGAPDIIVNLLGAYQLTADDFIL